MTTCATCGKPLRHRLNRRRRYCFGPQLNCLTAQALNTKYVRVARTDVPSMKVREPKTTARQRLTKAIELRIQTIKAWQRYQRNTRTAA